MRTSTRAAILLIFPLIIIGLVACGADEEPTVSSDGVSSGADLAAVDDHTDDADDHADDVEVHAEETALAAHNDDPHDDSIADDHAEIASEAVGHGHGAANEVDPDAPVIHVFGHEFGYESVTSEVVASQPFTIMFHNEGLVEHDITFEGLEEMGGIHLQPGEDGKATFSLDEIGEYSYYCTVPGHHEAGMISKLAVVASLHDEDDGHHDEDAVLDVHDDTDDHHDEDPMGVDHDEGELVEA